MRLAAYAAILSALWNPVDGASSHYTTLVYAQTGGAVRPKRAADACTARRRSIAAHIGRRAAAGLSYASAGRARAASRSVVQHAVVRHLGGRDDLGHLLSVDEEEILHGGTTGRRDSQLPWLGWARDGQRKGAAWLAVEARPGPRKASRGRGTPFQTSLSSIMCHRESKILPSEVVDKRLYPT